MWSATNRAVDPGGGVERRLQPRSLMTQTLIALMFFPSSSIARSCFQNIESTLRSGGYSGPSDCSRANIKLHKVGAITFRDGNVFTVYDMVYRLSARSGGPEHGGQRLIFINKAGVYVGQYSLSPPPFHNVRLIRHRLLLDVPAKDGRAVIIGENGPPKAAFLDREVVYLYK